MENTNHFDVIIIGGSYSGLAAAMALGRSLRQVLIIDSGLPCNRQTPYSHNFLTQDGSKPADIASIGLAQVTKYPNVEFFSGLATKGKRINGGFEMQMASGEAFRAKKILFASGIKDIMPAIDGFSECWGISVIHCPYCHGYEARNAKTGVFGNGDFGYEFVRMISNWTTDLTLYTNGPSTLTNTQTEKLKNHQITILEKELAGLDHADGHLHHIIFKDGSIAPLSALYAPRPFEQHSKIPELLGCELTEEGYVKVDAMQKTTVDGIYAAGDCASRIRTVANAVATGTTAGMMLNKEFITENF